MGKRNRRSERIVEQAFASALADDTTGGRLMARALAEASGAVKTYRRDPLSALSALRETERLMPAFLRDACDEARERGCSWAEIGEALGVTRSTACNLYGPAGSRRTA